MTTSNTVVNDPAISEAQSSSRCGKLLPPRRSRGRSWLLRCLWPRGWARTIGFSCATASPQSSLSVSRLRWARRAAAAASRMMIRRHLSRSRIPVGTRRSRARGQPRRSRHPVDLVHVMVDDGRRAQAKRWRNRRVRLWRRVRRTVGWRGV